MGESEAIVKKCFDALNRKDVNGFIALFSEEISGHWNGITGDLKGLHYHYSKWFEAFPDAKAHVKRVFSSGDWPPQSSRGKSLTQENGQDCPRSRPQERRPR
jgi:hypothetical protein